MPETLPQTLSPRWVSEENYHITLKFMGRLDLETAGSLCDAALDIARKSNAFRIAVDLTPQSFRNSRSPRVIWLGIQPCPGLLSLAQGIDIAMEASGFARDIGRFTPHITIARCSGFGQMPKPGTEHMFVSWNVDEFALMQTKASTNGQSRRQTRYNTVRVFPLKSFNGV